MSKEKLFSCKYRIIFSLFGFLLMHLILLPGIFFESLDTQNTSFSIYEIISAPGFLLPEKGYITMLFIMVILGSAGYLLGYVQDRFRVSKVKTIRRSHNDIKTDNPYIKKIVKSPRNKSTKKKRPVGNLLSISNRFFIILLTGAVLFSTLIPDIWQSSVLGCRSECSYFETDAQNTLAALASYFSEPGKNEVPTLEDLIRTEDLTLNEGSIVIIDGPKDAIRISVIDKKKKCPRGNIYEVYMGGARGDWYTVKKIDPHDPELRPHSFF